MELNSKKGKDGIKTMRVWS